MSSPKRIVILAGPTASGKTEISIEIAKILPDIEIISADSMQIYRNMDIGTDKPIKTQLKMYKHHCIDIVDPTESFDVKKYIVQAEKCISDILQRGKKPLFVGGTGLYIKSLINPLFEGPGRNQSIRDKLQKLADEKGSNYLFEELKKYDLEYSKKISVNDIRRIIRGLEVFLVTGKPLSYFHKHNQKAEEQDYSSIKDIKDAGITDNLKKNNYCLISIFRNRKVLYKRIDDRVDKIIEDGLIDEVILLMKKYGNIDNFNAMQGLGYKQILSYLQGKLTKDEAIETIKKKTRHFAKRQISWFKNQIKVDYQISMDDYKDNREVIDKIVDIMREEGY